MAALKKSVGGKEERKAPASKAATKKGTAHRKAPAKKAEPKARKRA